MTLGETFWNRYNLWLLHCTKFSTMIQALVTVSGFKRYSYMYNDSLEVKYTNIRQNLAIA